jgi:hypothetical protein
MEMPALGCVRLGMEAAGMLSGCSHSKGFTDARGCVSFVSRGGRSKTKSHFPLIAKAKDLSIDIGSTPTSI